MNFAGNSVTYKNKEVETTEWEDVLVKHGIISEREELVAQRAVREEARNRSEKEESVEENLGRLSLEQLDEVEDDYEEDTLAKLREKRLAELRKKAELDRFGYVYNISKPDFVREVTEASKACWVIVEMFKEGIEESSKASELVRELATKEKQVKFVRIRSTDCVEGWPDKSVPCFFIYRGGVMVKQVIGLDFCGGNSGATVDKMMHAFALLGILSSDLEYDPNEVSAQEHEEQQEVAREAEEDAQDRSKISKTTVSSLPKSKVVRGAVLESLDAEDDDGW